MSLDALRWAMSRRLEDASSKLLLIVLADCHNGETGRCDPSLDYICERGCLSRTTAKAKIQELIEMGLVTRVARFGPNGAQRSSAFCLHLDRGDGYTPRRSTPADQQDPELTAAGYPAPKNDTSAGNLIKVPSFVPGPKSDPSPVATRPPPRSPAGPPGGRQPAPEPGSIEPGRYEPLPAGPAKARNLPWEALARLDGWTEGAGMTKGGGSCIGKCLREVKGACPDLGDAELAAEITRRAGRFHAQWPGLTLTSTALVKHWARFAGAPQEAKPTRKRWQISAAIEEVEREIEMHPANQNLWMGGQVVTPSPADVKSLEDLRVRLHTLRQELNHADE